jgi:hypothetical protein
VLKIANAMRNHASAFGIPAFVSPVAKVFESDAVKTTIPSESQKPPYVENAVAPKTLRFRNSHMPARSCATPP